jgi:hypothetical protein
MEQLVGAKCWVQRGHYHSLPASIQTASRVEFTEDSVKTLKRANADRLRVVRSQTRHCVAKVCL